MKTALILGILLIAANAGFNINTDGCQAEKYDNWDAVRFPIQGGSGDFEFNFERLPQGWYSNKDRVYIPKGKVQKNKYYSTKVTVFDKKDKQYLKRSLLLNYDNDLKFGRVFDADYDYDFDDRNNLDSFLNSRGRGNGGFYDHSQVVFNQRSDAGSNVVTRADSYIPSQAGPSQIVPNYESRRDQVVIPNQVVIPSQVVISSQVVPSQVVVTNYRPEQVIVPSFRPELRPVVRPSVDDDRNRNPYYDNFPGDDEVERVISNLDCSKIREIINYVCQSGFNCKARAEYLEKLQNKLQVKIAIFRTDAEKNRQPIFGLQQQLKVLKEKLEKINFVPAVDYSERVRGYRSEIERHQRDRAGYQNEYRSSKDSVDRLRGEIESIRGSTAECRNGYDQEDRRIKQIESRIAELQDKLRDLRSEREQCAGRREKHRNGLGDSDRRIEECNNKIRYHQGIIDGYEKKAKYCNDNIQEINRKIEQCRREDDNNGRDKPQDIRNKIALIEEQIANYNRQADRLVRLFTEYEKYQNQFEALINKHYYGCYQYTAVQDNDHKDDKYTAPSSAFVSYMKDVFGQAPNENIRARFSGTVNIRKNTIFSPAWTKVYGIPYSAGYGNNKDVSEDNFSCIETSPDKLKVFSGRVEDITKNVIQVVSKTGDRYTVHLGGCTRIQSIADKQLPEKGSEIYFKGYERSEKSHYNGYHITCY